MIFCGGKAFKFLLFFIIMKSMVIFVVLLILVSSNVIARDVVIPESFKTEKYLIR